jgi:Protein of unknown function (DUF2384)
MKERNESVPVSFAGWDRSGSIPGWAKELGARRTTVEEVSSSPSLEGIIVIDARSPEKVIGDLIRTKALASWCLHTADPVQVVFSFNTTERPKSDWLMAEDCLKIFRKFPRTHDCIDFAWGRDHLEETVWKAIAKYYFQKEKSRNSATDALAEAKEVIAATKPLLSAKGRLSSDAVANSFGISEAKLAKLIGSSRQALSKTPDSAAIQDKLRPYERIARLRALLDRKEFLAWLELPNRHLGGDSPMQVIDAGEVVIVADLVESMLTGTPS